MGYSIPVMQVRHKSCVIYYQYIRLGPRFKNLRLAANMRKQQRQQYSGKMSPGAKKRLTKAITLLTQSVRTKIIYNEVTKRHFPHRLSFLTLTVSDPAKKLTGKEAYSQLLSHFLQWLRRTLHINTYIWKAEHQKNGQIHYHITTPAYIHWQKVRDKWNNLQRKAGLLDKYAREHGSYDANSTDIHEVKGINDLAAYLIKYITKSYQNADDLGGKVWDCSENLSRAQYFTLPLTHDHERFIRMAQAHDLCTIFHDERYSIIKFREPPAETLLTTEELQQYTEHLWQIQKTIEKPLC